MEQDERCMHVEISIYFNTGDVRHLKTAQELYQREFGRTPSRQFLGYIQQLIHHPHLLLGYGLSQEAKKVQAAIKSDESDPFNEFPGKEIESKFEVSSVSSEDLAHEGEPAREGAQESKPTTEPQLTEILDAILLPSPDVSGFMKDATAPGVLPDYCVSCETHYFFGDAAVEGQERRFALTYNEHKGWHLKEKKPVVSQDSGPTGEGQILTRKELIQSATPIDVTMFLLQGHRNAEFRGMIFRAKAQTLAMNTSTGRLYEMAVTDSRRPGPDGSITGRQLQFEVEYVGFNPLVKGRDHGNMPSVVRDLTTLGDLVQACNPEIRGRRLGFEPTTETKFDFATAEPTKLPNSRKDYEMMRAVFGYK